MTTFGVTSTGFVPKTLDDCKTSIEDKWHAQFGADADVTPQSPDGQIIGIASEMFAELWEGLLAVYSSEDPDQNSGAAQDATAAITGTTRAPAKQSTVVITVCSDVDSVLVANGRVFSIPGALTRFDSLNDQPTFLADDYSMMGPGDVVTLGERVWVTVSAVSRVYQCTVGGSIDHATALTTGSEATSITDGSAAWTYVGRGKASADLDCVSEDYGAIQGLSRTISVIETPVVSVNTAINLLDATLGSDIESDAALRVRRELELRTTGNAVIDSIRAHVLEVTGVTACTVLENVTDVVDANGLPAKSVRAIVTGGDDQEIAAAVWTKAGGIATSGTTTMTVIDTAGFPHSVSFSRPTALNIYIDILAYYDAASWPADGVTQIIEAVVAYGDLSVCGKDVISSALGAQSFKVAGVLDVVHCYIGVAPTPGSSLTIPVSPLQLAAYDSSRITVTAVAVTP